MHFSSSLFAFSIAFATLCTATPLVERGTCTPDFQGKAVSIVNPPTGEWTPTELKANYYLTTETGSTGVGEFRVEQEPTGFIFKAENVPANNLVVSAKTGSLRLQNYDSDDNTQTFYVTCQSCGSGSSNVNAYGCSIKSTGLGVCVESTGTGGGPFIVACDASASNQSWDIINTNH